MTIDYEREYDNSAAVADSARLKDAYGDDAAAFREEWEHATRDIAYGPANRNDLDIFWPDEKSSYAKPPIAMFIHGGYWRSLDRRVFSHMARGVVLRGVAVAIPSYTLAPEASVAEIIDELRRAVLFLHRTYGVMPVVYGHSAGGHLAACLASTDWRAIDPALPERLVPAALGISGVYDLEPLVGTSNNDTLGLDIETARAVSPIYELPPGGYPFRVWVGADETGEFVRQSRDFARRWRMLGADATFHPLEGTNHFTVIDPLTGPDSEMVDQIVGFCGAHQDNDGEEQV